jgi:hypothetical protein
MRTGMVRLKWIASDIPCGLATGVESEYNEKNIPCIEIPCGLAGGSLQKAFPRFMPDTNKIIFRSR